MPGWSYVWLLQSKLYIIFWIFFQVTFEIVCIWPMYYSFDLHLLYFLSKRVTFSSKYGFSLWNCDIFCPSSCSPNNLTFWKSVFELEHFFHNSKIHSIEVRQLNSFTKMMLSSAKFIVFTPWFAICMLFFGISENCKDLIIQ